MAAQYNYADVPFDLGMEYTDTDFDDKKGDYYFKSQSLKVMSNYIFL